jgi:hypothetical protein
MKVLSLVLILIGLFLLTEGGKVSTVKRGGNVCVKVLLSNSKQMLGLMKILDKKLNQIITNTRGPLQQGTLSLARKVSIIAIIQNFDIVGHCLEAGLKSLCQSGDVI